MDPQLEAVTRRLSRELTAMAQRLTALENGTRQSQMNNSSIDGGSLPIYDSTGVLRQVIGLQADGTVTTVDQNAPPPELAPSQPLCQDGIEGIYVAWDGLMFDQSLPVSDFKYVEVHVSANTGFTPDTTTLQGTLPAQGLFGVGNLPDGSPYYCVLVAVNTSGVSGPPSIEGTANSTPPPLSIPAGYISGTQIQTGAITAINIAPGTITSNLIAANAIVAGLIQAGAIDGQVINGITINGNKINAADIFISGAAGGLFLYSTGGPTVLSYAVNGARTWICPPAVTSVKVECWGAGGGGGGGSGTIGGPGGGAGEYAAEPAVPVTPGTSYSFTVGNGGTAGAANAVGIGGTRSIFTGDTGVTVMAHGGSGGRTGMVGGPGGTGSTNAVHFDGGTGGSNTGSGPAQHGSGGGSSGSENGTGVDVPNQQRTGGAALADGGPGGAGGTSAPTAGSAPSIGPGGGGGGGGFGDGGGHGFDGQIRLTFQASTTTLTGSIAGAAGIDPLSSVAYPEGAKFDNLEVSNVLTADGAEAVLGALSVAGNVVVGGALYEDPAWTTVSTGFAGSWTGSIAYRLLADNLLLYDIKLVATPGTTTVSDGFTIFTLPAAYRPVTFKILAAETDQLKVSGSGFEACTLHLLSTGVLQCHGVATTATALSCSGVVGLDI